MPHSLEQILYETTSIEFLMEMEDVREFSNVRKALKGLRNYSSIVHFVPKEIE